MLQNVLTAAAAVFPVAKCRLLPALSFIDCLTMPFPSLSLLPHSHSGFTTRHSQSANPLAAAKLSLVVVTHCVLVMRHTQLCRSLLRLSVCPPLAVVGCFVSSVNVCVYVCVCVRMRVCVFNYKMSDMLKIKFTARLILLILVHSLSISPSLPCLTFAKCALIGRGNNTDLPGNNDTHKKRLSLSLNSLFPRPKLATLCSD